MIFMPPGVSSTRANSRRAIGISALMSPPPVSARSSSRSWSSFAAAQDASRSATRLDISAAAALVKVRQRILAGGTLPSSRRSTRSPSTLVLPDPAEADTQADQPGSEPRRCASVASRRMSRLVTSIVFALAQPFGVARQVRVVVVGRSVTADRASRHRRHCRRRIRAPASISPASRLRASAIEIALDRIDPLRHRGCRTISNAPARRSAMPPMPWKPPASAIAASSVSCGAKPSAMSFFFGRLPVL